MLRWLELTLAVLLFPAELARGAAEGAAARLIDGLRFMAGVGAGRGAADIRPPPPAAPPAPPPPPRPPRADASPGLTNDNAMTPNRTTVAWQKLIMVGSMAEGTVGKRIF
jgi:hypothetical protein